MANIRNRKTSSSTQKSKVIQVSKNKQIVAKFDSLAEASKSLGLSLKELKHYYRTPGSTYNDCFIMAY